MPLQLLPLSPLPSPGFLKILAVTSVSLFFLSSPSSAETKDLCGRSPKFREAIIAHRKKVIVSQNLDPNILLERQHYCDNIIAVSSQSLNLVENKGSYTVVLGAKPGKDVIISVNTRNSAISVSPNLLTFTTDNWDQEQTVNVSSIDNVTGKVIYHELMRSEDSYYDWLQRKGEEYEYLPLEIAVETEDIKSKLDDFDPCDEIAAAQSAKGIGLDMAKQVLEKIGEEEESMTATGAAIGSVVPGIGTIIGAGMGKMFGAILSKGADNAPTETALDSSDCL